MENSFFLAAGPIDHIYFNPSMHSHFSHSFRSFLFPHIEIFWGEENSFLVSHCWFLPPFFISYFTGSLKLKKRKEKESILHGVCSGWGSWTPDKFSLASLQQICRNYVVLFLKIHRLFCLDYFPFFCSPSARGGLNLALQVEVSLPSNCFLSLHPLHIDGSSV